MVERFNGCINEVKVYNQHIPQKALGHVALIQAFKDWTHTRPERFKKRVRNLPREHSSSFLPHSAARPIEYVSTSPERPRCALDRVTLQHLQTIHSEAHMSSRSLGMVLGALCCILTTTASLATDSPADALALPRYAVGMQEMVLSNGDPADVYAPRIRPERQDRFEDAFPLIALLQGANVERSQYSQLAQALARSGLVVVVPDHEAVIPGTGQSGLFTDVSVVQAVLDQLSIEDADPGSPLYGIIDTERMGLVGHSYGGMIGLYASADQCLPPFCLPRFYERPAALRAAAFYGTHLTEGDSVTDLATSTVAVALLAGTRDGVATPDEIDLTFPILERPHALISIEGANHYGLCNQNNPLGANPDLLSPTLDQELGILRIAQWMAHWLWGHF